MIKISLIHPSKGRPKQAKYAMQAWLQSAKHRDQIEYILSIDTDETNGNKIAYHDIHADTLMVYGNKSAIEAINRAAEVSKGNLIVVMSDDFNQPPFHWDASLLTMLEGKKDFIVKTDDGAQPWIITLPIMDRKYYERFGYVYNPLFQHMFSDTAMTHIGHILGKVIELPMRFLHNHYSTGKMPKDYINDKNDRTWAQGEEMYLWLLDRNFMLSLDEIVNAPLKCCHKTHLDWLRTKGVV